MSKIMDVKAKGPVPGRVAHVQKYAGLSYSVEEIGVFFSPKGGYRPLVLSLGIPGARAYTQPRQSRCCLSYCRYVLLDTSEFPQVRIWLGMRLCPEGYRQGNGRISRKALHRTGRHKVNC